MKSKKRGRELNGRRDVIQRGKIKVSYFIKGGTLEEEKERVKQKAGNKVSARSQVGSRERREQNLREKKT